LNRGTKFTMQCERSEMVKSGEAADDPSMSPASMYAYWRDLSVRFGVEGAAGSTGLASRGELEGIGGGRGAEAWVLRLKEKRGLLDDAVLRASICSSSSLTCFTEYEMQNNIE
jgi:hypothetical protein